MTGIYSRYYRRGFTLLQLLIAIGILVILALVSIPPMVSLLKRPQLDNSAQEVMSVLKVAQNKTLSSEGNSTYGVYFKTNVTPHQYVLFKGPSYALHEPTFDKTYTLPSMVEFFAVNTGGGNEVVFDKLTGSTVNAGNISLRIKDDITQTSVVYIDNAGVIGFVAPTAYSGSERIKDARHVDFGYSRVINTATENMVLTFDGNNVQTIAIAPNLSNGQIDWQGTFVVSGTSQTVRIHTLRLNNPDTLFSVHRDRRYNDKSLTIKLSGDATGSLVEYVADGLTTNVYSIYVNNFSWQ